MRMLRAAFSKQSVALALLVKGGGAVVGACALFSLLWHGAWLLLLLLLPLPLLLLVCSGMPLFPSARIVRCLSSLSPWLMGFRFPTSCTRLR